MMTVTYADNSTVFKNKKLGTAAVKIETAVNKKLVSITDSGTREVLGVMQGNLLDLLHDLDDAIATRNKSQFETSLSKFLAQYRLLQSTLKLAPKGADVKKEDDVKMDTGTGAKILYYADSFEGKRTAGGDVFSQTFFSAARCVTPLNTLIQVINGERSVIVKNNDRPNCAVHADIIDLSKNAFTSIGKLSTGKLSGSIISLR